MLFISHSAKDKAAAIDVRDRLLQSGYSPEQIFLDSDRESGIKPGADWEQKLYEGLKKHRALIVLCSPNWLDSKWCFAELVYAKSQGKDIFPVVLEDCPLDAIVTERQAVFPRRDGDAAFQCLFDELDNKHLGPTDDFGWPPPGGDNCPFPGLFAFDEKHAAVYFGRDDEIRDVCALLNTMRGRGEPRLLMIEGGSGSGKSSLLRAGVLPRLTPLLSTTEIYVSRGGWHTLRDLGGQI